MLIADKLSLECEVWGSDSKSHGQTPLLYVQFWNYTCFPKAIPSGSSISLKSALLHATLRDPQLLNLNVVYIPLQASGHKVVHRSCPELDEGMWRGPAV